MTGTEKQTLTVAVYSPKTPDPKEFTWPKTMKVGDAADEAAKAFGYDPDTEPPTFQNADGKVFDRNKPLIAEHVKDGDSLELVSSGGGV